MRFPFLSRAHHEEVVSLLRAQLKSVETERQLYLDRLATAGLGGAFFHAPAVAPEAAEESTADPQLSDQERMQAMRRRPSRMAQLVTRKMRKDFERKMADDGRALHIRKEIEDDLDAAEEAGRRKSA